MSLLEFYLSWRGVSVCMHVHALVHMFMSGLIAHLGMLFLGHCSLFGARSFAGLENSIIRLGWVASKSQRSVCLFQYRDKDVPLCPAFLCGLACSLILRCGCCSRWQCVLSFLGFNMFASFMPLIVSLSSHFVCRFATLYVYVSLPAHLSVYHLCALLSLEVRMGHQIPQNGSYRLLWVTMLALVWTWNWTWILWKNNQYF